MFSAISSFFFGSEKAPAETPVEYDIREDEDEEWMLVDVSEDKENLLNPIKDNECAQNCDKNDRDEMKSCKKDGEVVSDPAFEHIPSLSDSEKQTIPYVTSFQPMDISVDSSWEIPAHFFSTNSLNFIQSSHKSVLQVFKDDNFLSNSKAELVTSAQQQFSTKVEVTGINGTKVLYDVICLTNPAQPNLCNMKLREVTNKHKQQDVENTSVSVAAIKSKGTCRIRRPLLEQKTPVKLPKKEYMQQIQALMQQQTKEYQSKKYYENKAHLDRRNKVAMYESSNKNRHRRDLWQHHSGANNNRKCC